MLRGTLPKPIPSSHSFKTNFVPKRFRNGGGSQRACTRENNAPTPGARTSPRDKTLRRRRDGTNVHDDLCSGSPSRIMSAGAR